MIPPTPLGRPTTREMSDTEVADVLGITRQAVWTIERRALAKLREVMREEWEDYIITLRGGKD